MTVTEEETELVDLSDYFAPATRTRTHTLIVNNQVFDLTTTAVRIENHAGMVLEFGPKTKTLAHRRTKDQTAPWWKRWLG